MNLNLNLNLNFKLYAQRKSALMLLSLIFPPFSYGSITYHHSAVLADNYGASGKIEYTEPCLAGISESCQLKLTYYNFKELEDSKQRYPLDDLSYSARYLRSTNQDIEITFACPNHRCDQIHSTANHDRSRKAVFTLEDGPENLVGIESVLYAALNTEMHDYHVWYLQGSVSWLRHQWPSGWITAPGAYVDYVENRIVKNIAGYAYDYQSLNYLCSFRDEYWRPTIHKSGYSVKFKNQEKSVKAVTLTRTTNIVFTDYENTQIPSAVIIHDKRYNTLNEDTIPKSNLITGAAIITYDILTYANIPSTRLEHYDGDEWKTCFKAFHYETEPKYYPDKYRLKMSPISYAWRVFMTASITLVSQKAIKEIFLHNEEEVMAVVRFIK